MWQGLAVHRKERTSREPALCKLLLPCGAISEHREKKGYLLPLRNFSTLFCCWLLTKGLISTPQKSASSFPLVKSGCFWVNPCKEHGSPAAVVNVHPHFSFIKSCYKWLCWLETAEHLALAGALWLIFILKRKENVAIRSTAFCQMESNFRLGPLQL